MKWLTGVLKDYEKDFNRELKNKIEGEEK